MTVKVSDISKYIDSVAPYSTKCSWDNCGILIGDKSAPVNRIGVCLDLTSQTLAQAEENKVDLLITHHPVIFSPKKNFLANDLVFKAATHGINIISAHTCFDCAKGGVNDYLCMLFDIENPTPVESDECVVPMARIGDVKTTTALQLAQKVSNKLDTTVCLIDGEKPINKVAVCGGAGMSFFNDILRENADAYITGEIKHHEMLEAKENGITVISAGHYETEYITMNALVKMIAAQFPTLDVKLINQDNPVIYINKEN